MDDQRRNRLEAVAAALEEFMNDDDLDTYTAYTYGEVLDRLGLHLQAASAYEAAVLKSGGATPTRYRLAVSVGGAACDLLESGDQWTPHRIADLVRRAVGEFNLLLSTADYQSQRPEHDAAQPVVIESFDSTHLNPIVASAALVLGLRLRRAGGYFRHGPESVLEGHPATTFGVGSSDVVTIGTADQLALPLEGNLRLATAVGIPGWEAQWLHGFVEGEPVISGSPLEQEPDRLEHLPAWVDPSHWLVRLNLGTALSLTSDRSQSSDFFPGFRVRDDVTNVFGSRDLPAFGLQFDALREGGLPRNALEGER